MHRPAGGTKGGAGVSRPAETVRDGVAQAAHDREPGARARLAAEAQRIERSCPDSGSLDHGPNEVRLELRFGKHATDILSGKGGKQRREPFGAGRLCRIDGDGALAVEAERELEILEGVVEYDERTPPDRLQPRTQRSLKHSDPLSRGRGILSIGVGAAGIVLLMVFF